MDTKELVKKYWNDRPCNIKHSKKDFGSIEYFNEVEQKKYFVEPHIPKFADFKKWEGKRVLEIGCGIGTDSINFVRNGAKLTIIEFSEKSLDVCKTRFKVFGLDAEFYLGNVEKLDEVLSPCKFDLIYSFGVIHHTPNPQKAFEQIVKYMEDSTELRIMLYSKISFKMIQMMFENNVRDLNDVELIRNNAEAQYGCPVAFTYLPEEIKDMLDESGIKVEKIWKDHIFTWDIPNYINNMYVKNEFWKNVDDKLLKAYESDLGWHTLVIGKIKI
jgi:ubiquinone/menaquinone biosynthesis C-methylase UbiE